MNYAIPILPSWTRKLGGSTAVSPPLVATAFLQVHSWGYIPWEFTHVKSSHLLGTDASLCSWVYYSVKHMPFILCSS